MPEAPDPYDQTSRYLARRNAGPVTGWLLSLAGGRLDFVQWLDTRRISWPGQPGRTCDTVAHLRDPARGGLPWAVVVEFQLRPDPDMFGRALVYLGQVWLELRPTPLPGDRFCVGCVVVNLTGKGDCGRDMAWQQAGLRTVLLPREWNLGELRAADILDGVEAGSVPRAVLAWLPLMQGGGDPAIMQRWLALAGQEPDAGRRADLGLALVFAEAAGNAGAWRKLLEGWNVTQSKQVQEWIDMGTSRGKIEGRVETLLDVLEARFGVLPPELAAALRQTTDLGLLRQMAARAGQADSLGAFRQEFAI
jgi:hypothetical protein